MVLSSQGSLTSLVAQVLSFSREKKKKWLLAKKIKKRIKYNTYIYNSGPPKMNDGDDESRRAANEKRKWLSNVFLLLFLRVFVFFFPENRARTNKQMSIVHTCVITSSIARTDGRKTQYYKFMHLCNKLIVVLTFRLSERL